MSRVLPLCFPATDLTFGERVRSAVDHGQWDLTSPDRIALVEARIRETYPTAIVRPRDAKVDGGWHPTVVLEVHRDGPEGAGRARRA